MRPQPIINIQKQQEQYLQQAVKKGIAVRGGKTRRRRVKKVVVDIEGKDGMTPQRKMRLDAGINQIIQSGYEDYSAKVVVQGEKLVTTTPTKTALTQTHTVTIDYNSSIEKSNSLCGNKTPVKKTCRIRLFAEPPAEAIMLNKKSSPVKALTPKKIQKLPALEQNIKTVGPVILTKKLLREWVGVRRCKTQNQVMANLGATDFAHYYKLVDNLNERFEWLHLIAHSFGGPDGNPQTADNLVAGTYYSNSDMMSFEAALREMLIKNEVEQVELTVKAHLVSDQTGKPLHAAERIDYIFKINETIYTVVFRPMEYKSKPSQFAEEVIPPLVKSFSLFSNNSADNKPAVNIPPCPETAQSSAAFLR